MPLWGGCSLCFWEANVLLFKVKKHDDVDFALKIRKSNLFSLSLWCPIRLCFQPKINFQSIDPEVNILIHKFIY